MKISILPAFEDNYIYILICEKTGKTAVVDPGDGDVVLRHCEEKDLKIDAILNTHHHWDHTDGNQKLIDRFECSLYAPTGEDRIKNVDHPLKQGDGFEIGEMSFKVIETPGHTKSHICYYSQSDKAIFCGDTLFSIGCGRLFEGTPKDMYLSMQKIAELPDETQVYCGHEYTLANIKFAKSLENPPSGLVEYEQEVKAKRAAGKPSLPSSLGIEKRLNPFLRAKTPDELAKVRQRKDNF